MTDDYDELIRIVVGNHEQRDVVVYDLSYYYQTHIYTYCH